MQINFISGVMTGIIDGLLARDIDYLSMGRVTRGVRCTCIALCIYACQRMRPTCGCALTHASKLRYNVAPANCSTLPTLFVSRPDGHESIRNHPRLRTPLFLLMFRSSTWFPTSLTRRDISIER